ncbi:MAG: Family S9 peptidase [candidate division TM6 bacterium GW2011_GWA2_36_9]|nr:MAG: Family S9 peptidase [candidate division TM6 bacterium GW2011_GWA2_36_9]
MKKRLIIIFILSGLAVWGFIYRYPWSVGISSRPMVCIGPHCGISQESVEVLEDELGLYERWRARSEEEPVTFYSQFAHISNELIARKGILITRPRARATILVMHGYTSNKIDMGILRLLFSPYNLLLFDFRAHGEDTEGQLSTLGYDEVHDVLAAVDFLRSHHKTCELPIIGYGFSMGAVTAIEAQAKDTSLFKALILDCPFDSTDGLIERGLDRALGKVNIPLIGEYDIPGRSFLKKYATNRYVQPVLLSFLRLFAGMDSTKVPTMPKRVQPIKSAKNLNIPVQFIHCYADEHVPVDALLKIYNNVPCYKRLWLTKGARHFGSLFNNPELYQQMVANFIEKILNESIGKECQERIIADMTRHELEQMHARRYKYPLDNDIVDRIYTIKK